MGEISMESRGERLQIMLTKEELVALDNWRFDRRMPSRAAAIRELLRRGLSAEGFAVSDGSTKSGDFSVISGPETNETSRDDGARVRSGGT
jgi:metal-responsive CopG/Arc/MetJ family transcriptional regulator